jgi:AcrR family transcriptional regulator
MDTSQTDRRSVDQRREELIDAAIVVIARDGLPGATTRRITEQAGLALGAFHYAFRSKDELLAAVIERIVDAVAAVLRRVETQPSDGLAATTDALVTGFWEFTESTPELQLAVYELTVHALRDPKLHSLAVQQYERYADAVEQVLERVAGLPGGTSRRDLARFVVATIDGLVLQSLVHPDPEAARRRLRLYVRSLRGLEPDPERETPAAAG